MVNIIHILGASGSGTTTLGKALNVKYGYAHFDLDDYFWQPTDPPYTTKREIIVRQNLLKEDMSQVTKCVLTGSMCGWGDMFIPRFDLVIYVSTPVDTRIERLRQREYALFGNRILLGGDMVTNHCEFIEWAKTYDTAGLNSRSYTLHQQWLKQMTCPVLEIDGTCEVEAILIELDSYLNNEIELQDTDCSVLGKTVTVTVDRPIGSVHPQHKDLRYPVNYGYIKGVMAGDGEEQDAYIVGVSEPVAEYTGKVIAIIHRKDDVEDKWVVAPDEIVLNEPEIRATVNFKNSIMMCDLSVYMKRAVVPYCFLLKMVFAYMY